MIKKKKCILAITFIFTIYYFYFNFNLKYLFRYKILLTIKLSNSYEKLINSHVFFSSIYEKIKNKKMNRCSERCIPL